MKVWSHVLRMAYETHLYDTTAILHTTINWAVCDTCLDLHADECLGSAISCIRCRLQRDFIHCLKSIISDSGSVSLLRAKEKIYYNFYLSDVCMRSEEDYLYLIGPSR
jgi:hypothetical protein